MKNRRFLMIGIVFILILGIGAVLYPLIADYISAKHQTRIAAGYAERVQLESDNRLAQALSDAQAYNENLFKTLGLKSRWSFSDADSAAYSALLNLGGDSVMGIIEIPAIDVSLPIYHSTSEGALQVGVGHMEGSSLPVGGPSTHCVLSAHTGLPSSTLFTHLDQLALGDQFTLHVLKQDLVYEVDQILVVEPADKTPLAIVPGKDYCTLMTCTPYGINTQRLLVRGHRLLTASPQSLASQNAAVQTGGGYALLIIAAPFMAAAVLVTAFRRLRAFALRRRNTRANSMKG